MTVNCVGRCSLENKGKHADICSLCVRAFFNQMHTEQSYSQLSGILVITAEVKKLEGHTLSLGITLCPIGWWVFCS